MREDDTRHYIVQDREADDLFGGFRAERTMRIDAVPGYRTAHIHIIGPRGGAKDDFVATPEWLREAGNAMLEAAATLKEVTP